MPVSIVETGIFVRSSCIYAANWATSMALGFGPIVTVLEPVELRASIREWANAIAEQYESDLQVIGEGAGGKDV